MGEQRRFFREKYRKNRVRIRREMDRGGQPRQNEIARSQVDVPLNNCTPSAGGGEWKRWVGPESSETRLCWR